MLSLEIRVLCMEESLFYSTCNKRDQTHVACEGIQFYCPYYGISSLAHGPPRTGPKTRLCGRSYGCFSRTRRPGRSPELSRLEDLPPRCAQTQMLLTGHAPAFYLDLGRPRSSRQPLFQVLWCYMAHRISWRLAQRIATLRLEDF